MQGSMQSTKTYDVVVIGAGFSGLLCCKYAMEKKLSVLVLEKQDGLGGIWNYSDDPNRPSVYKSTITTSSRIISEISDFPMPEDYPNFPRHTQMLHYMEDYAKHFDLMPHIQFSVDVVSIEKEGCIWRVLDQNGQVVHSRNIILCTGVHQTPNDIRDTKPFNQFTGKMIHSSEYRYLTPEYHDKNVLVYGGGESASDIAHELSSVTKKLFWCIPNGQWFLDRLPGSVPVDYTINRFTEVINPFSSKNKLLARELRDSHLNGFNIPEFKSQAPHSRAFFTKNVECHKMITLGRITPVPAITNINGHTIECEQDSAVKRDVVTTLDVDIIILASGFKKEFPMLPDKYQIPTYDLYNLIFCKEDLSLAFVGFVRPTFGSIFGVAEMQARYAMHVIAEKTSPGKELIERKIASDKEHYTKLFQHTSQRTEGLVEHMYYTDDLAKQCGLYPNFKKLFFKSPRKCLQAYLGPLHGCQYMLNDEMNHHYIFDEIYGKYRHLFHREINPIIRSKRMIFFIFISVIKNKILSWVIFTLPKVVGINKDR